MTGRRTRLARLEAQHGLEGQAGGIFDADLEAGVWREKGGGRTLPLDPATLEGEAVAVLLLDPRGQSKIILGIEGDDL